MLSNGEEEKNTTYKQEHRRITDGQWQQEAPLGELPGRTLRRCARHCSGRLSVHILSAISRVIKIPLPTRLNPPTHWHTTHTHTRTHRQAERRHSNISICPCGRSCCRHEDIADAPSTWARARVTLPGSRQSFIRIKGSGMQRVRK